MRIAVALRVEFGLVSHLDTRFCLACRQHQRKEAIGRWRTLKRARTTTPRTGCSDGGQAAVYPPPDRLANLDSIAELANGEGTDRSAGPQNATKILGEVRMSPAAHKLRRQQAGAKGSWVSAPQCRQHLASETAEHQSAAFGPTWLLMLMLVECFCMSS